MKASIFTAVVLAAVVSTALAGALRVDPVETQRSTRKATASGDRYVVVTGSHIPQKVKVKAIGTSSGSPLRVYGRSEIDRTGRFTTTSVVAEDPSIRGFGR